MARLTGDDGNISLPSGHGGNIRIWTATVSYTASEVTAFGDTQNRRFRRGLPTVAGTLSGVPEGGGTGDPGVGATGGSGAGSGAGGASMTLTAVTGSTWVFQALVVGIGLSLDKVGDALITYDFVIGDANSLVETWA